VNISLTLSTAVDQLVKYIPEGFMYAWSWR